MIDEVLLANMWDVQNKLNRNTIDMIAELQNEVSKLKKKLSKTKSQEGLDKK